MPIIRLNNGNIVAEGSLTALHVTTGDVSTETMSVTGQLTASGDITANNITGDVYVTGTAHATSIQADTFNAGHIQGLTTIEGDVQATTIQATEITGLTTINGDVSTNSLTSGTTTIAGEATLGATTITGNADITGDAAVNGDVSANSLTSGTTTVSGEATLGATTITGDVTINGGMDTGLNGDPVVTINTNSFTISHKVWFNNTTQSTIAVLPGVWNNAIKTCYLKTNIPVTLTGVIRIDDNPEMESGKTYIFALQQIDETNIIANIAYSVTI